MSDKLVCSFEASIKPHTNFSKCTLIVVQTSKIHPVVSLTIATISQTAKLNGADAKRA